MRPHPRLRISVLGVRGLPDVQGGIETHAQQLYRQLADLGCEIDVMVRTPFVPRGVREYGPIRLTRLWSPMRPGFEALVHSIIGVFFAAFKRPDVLHIHGVGPAIVTPLARAFGLRVVVTHHGPDYDREKWGRFARAVLRVGERLGVNCSNARIAVSKVIVDLMHSRYGASSDHIPNGVVSLPPLSTDEHVRRFGLERGKYFLQVSRIVPEKRQLDLIRAYASVQNRCDWKLVLVGSGAGDAYTREVEAAAASAGVVLTGFVKGEPLRQMYSHAGGFVLPSSHEGLPIALLEALSYGLPVIASRIPANVEIGLESSNYFSVGDTDVLATQLLALAEKPVDAAARERRIAWVTGMYDWERIAAETHAVYQRICA